ncbi:MAG TPA: hypothetical protein VKB02_08725 [Pyrinomonadaceae bacterium]|nr:hypothetical protein [Pyrinomonadaceae bacterium]
MQPTSVDSQSARDELFRRIGRNVVNFQYLEATLRMMIPTLSNKGTLKELQANQDAVVRKHKKATLRPLANAYHERMYGKSVTDEEPSDDALSEPTFTFGIGLDVPPEKAEERKRALVKVIRERNRLIHEDLLNVDLKSREECEELSARLDEQYIRIRRYLDHLNSLRVNFQQMTADFARLLESEEFRALLMGDCDDAQTRGPT